MNITCNLTHYDINLIRSQLDEWAERGRFVALLREEEKEKEEWEEEEKKLKEYYANQKPVESKFTNPVDFSNLEVEGGFEF